MCIEKQRTSLYNPKTNDLIENFHKVLKAAIIARIPRSWKEILPTFPISFRYELRTDIEATPAELVKGTIIRNPVSK